jgi:NAD+ diphosphatase
VTSASAVRDLAPLPLTGAGIDRAAALRLDEPRLASAWRDPPTRVLLVHEATVAVTPDGDALALLAPAAAPAGERFFLGADPDGVAFFAVVLAAVPADGPRFAGVREVGTLLSERDAGLMVHAVGLAGWHRTHRYCGRCGQPTVTGAAGHVRTCTGCGAEHYPRTDPAVIMLVTDADDRALLGTRHVGPVSRWSTLAGFVEPGETLERAVAREVAEEAGITVTSVRYVSSQPWPFPYSIMLGFLATADDTAITVDGEEIAEARWFTRAELKEKTEAGEMAVPTPLSISRRLVELWYGGELPG